MSDILQENVDKYHFFWEGPFSQWHSSPFIVEGVRFCCAEQYMMMGKAKIFGDYEIMRSIMESTNPKVIKALGRKVKDFDQDIWMKYAFGVVCNGNYYKFRQNKDLLNILIKTKGKTLVEASPFDKIWGIGMGKYDALRTPANEWPGMNLLGKAITKVRDTFYM